MIATRDEAVAALAKWHCTTCWPHGTDNVACGSPSPESRQWAAEWYADKLAALVGKPANLTFIQPRAGDWGWAETEELDADAIVANAEKLLHALIARLTEVT